MPAPSRDPRQAGSGSTDTSHLFSTLHNAEIRSMFLPHGSGDKAASGGEKVIALSLGNLCLPPKGISASQDGPTSASILNPLSHYWFNNAVLCGGNPHGSSSGSNGNTSSASTVTSILENGKVLVHTLMNDQDGPTVVGTIDAPSASPAWGAALNAAGGGDGGAGGSDISLPMAVTCGSFIPAEIAIQQFWQVHHTLAPGSLLASQPGSASATARRSKSPNTTTTTEKKSNNNSSGGQAGIPTSSVFQEPLLPNKDTSSADTTQLDRVSSGDEAEAAAADQQPPPPTLTINDQDINLVSSVADALLGDDPISKSWRRRPDAREALEAHYSKHTGSEWRSTVVNHLWRGVVGTESGEVFVFNGERYCFGFRCGAQKPPATRREVDQQQQGDSSVPEYKKVVPSQSGSVSSAGIVSVHAVILPDESEGGGGGLMATKIASQEASTGGTPTSRNQNTNSTNNASSMNGGGNISSNRMSNLSMATFQSDYQMCTRVGIVTLQSDGNICVWKVKLPSSSSSPRGGGSKAAASAPAIDAVPVRLIQPSLLAKVRTLTVSHQYTIPMDLSNFGAVFSASAGQDLGSQFGWDDAFTPQQHPFVQELDTLLSSSSSTANKKKGTDSGLASNPSFGMECSTAAFTPAEYLPFISIIAFSGPGYDASVALRSGFGHVLDCDSKGDDVSIGDSRLRHTTAMAMEGDCVLVARERAVHLILFGDRSIRKLMTTRSRVRSLVIDRPIAIAGCQNGDIHVFASDSGTPLTTYSTYNGSPVKALSFNYQSMLLTIVDEDSGEVELVSLPGILLRYGVLPPEKMLTRQGAVLRHTMALQETPSWKISAKREASERRLLAKFSLANCVEQYLNFRTKLI